MTEQKELKTLPTQQATNFAGSLNYAEILISIGDTRVTFGVDENGAVVPRASPEWLVTLSMSPQAATQLRDILGSALGLYEQQFGKIPADPNQKLNASEIAAAGIVAAPQG